MPVFWLRRQGQPELYEPASNSTEYEKTSLPGLKNSAYNQARLPNQRELVQPDLKQGTCFVTFSYSADVTKPSDKSNCVLDGGAFPENVY